LGHKGASGASQEVVGRRHASSAFRPPIAPFARANRSVNESPGPLRFCLCHLFNRSGRQESDRGDFSVHSHDYAGLKDSEHRAHPVVAPVLKRNVWLETVSKL
jgi:hypothetical protein